MKTKKKTIVRKKQTHFDVIIDKLLALKKAFPNQPLSNHLSGALSDYPNFWGISDKELLFALDKYETEMEQNNYTTNDKELERIIEEGKNLDKIKFNEEEDEWQ